jgi:hypothetical protein
MAKPYMTIKINVNEDNLAATKKLDVDSGFADLNCASSTFQAMKSGVDNFDRLRGDSRSLKFIGKTPKDIKRRATDELKKNNDLSVALISDAFATVIEKFPKMHNPMTWLSQQVGNNGYFSAQNFLNSKHTDFVFDGQCQGVTSSNTLEVSGDPFYSANKVSDSSFYYMRANDGSQRVMYMNSDGEQKVGLRADVQKLVAAGQCIPLVIATSQAIVKPTIDGKQEISTSLSYHIQPDMLQWEGPQYPGMRTSPFDPQQPWVAVEDSINNLNSFLLDQVDLLSQYPSGSKEAAYLKHDFDQLRTVLPSLKKQLENIKITHEKNTKSSPIMRRFLGGDSNKAIIELQAAIRQCESDLYLTLDNLSDLRRIVTARTTATAATEAAIADSGESRPAVGKPVVSNDNAITASEQDKENINSNSFLPLKRQRGLIASEKNDELTDSSASKASPLSADENPRSNKKPKR